MKKVSSIVLVLVIVLSLCSCGKEGIEYYEINSKLPIPSGVEQRNMIDNGEVVSYFYHMDVKNNEEAEEKMREYTSVLKEEGISVVYNAEIGFELKYNDELIGMTMWFSMDDEYSLVVHVRRVS